MTITPALLLAAVGCTPERAALYAPHLSAACAHYGINAPARLAAFLAQLAHESGAFRWVRELADGSAYEGRKDLGNTQPGDGPRFRGRGLIQITGRSNYRQAAQRMRELDAPDFEDFPEALEEPQWAVWSAADWWTWRGLNDLADRGEFDAITRRINGGTNGAADRRARWERAKAALAALPVAPADDEAAAPAEPTHDPITPAAPAPAAVPTEWDMQQQPPEPSMPIPAVLGALLPSLIEQAPQLIRIFGSGGAVSERNAKAAERVAEIARAVTAQTTTEGAVQVLQSDPAKAAEYREQVHMSMGELLGLVDRLAHLDEQEHARIESSRDAAAARAAAEGDGEDAFLTRSLVGMMIAVMLGLAVLAGVLKWLGMDVQAIVGTLLTMVGVVGREFSTRIQYRYGSSRGSAAKDVVIDQISRRGPRG